VRCTPRHANTRTLTHWRACNLCACTFFTLLFDSAGDLYHSVLFLLCLHMMKKCAVYSRLVVAFVGHLRATFGWALLLFVDCLKGKLQWSSGVLVCGVNSGDCAFPSLCRGFICCDYLTH
jgi:hypothetical protein